MNGLEKFASIDKKFAWSFLGFVLAVFFGGLTIYNEFIKVRDPQMVVEVLSDTNVLDLKENVPELKILYGDVDIKSVGKDLSVIVFRVKNVGGASILGGFYDTNSPLTINLSNGEFLKYEKISASNEYLENFATVTKSTASSIQMPSVIMEPNESYTVKALVIHAAQSGVLLKSSGKIAGMREIPILKIEPDKDNESFWSKVFSGSIVVQAARAPLYFFAFIFGLAGLLVPQTAISTALQKRSRKKAISQFRNHINEPLPEGHEVIFEYYTRDGLAPLVRARELLGDAEKLKSALENIKNNQKTESRNELIFIDDNDFLENHGRSHVILNRGIAISILKKTAIAKIDQNGSIQIDSPKEKFLGKFIDYITIKES
ncbi:hypothetical protein ACQE3D_06335 [Methylomonas sp. MS20]|uniref:hypothetical protein n=1 Tax=unclassified Methylomonas TaxID=2608980 RepID=UPI0028A34B4F|nr:hypothetical protein [Methylomonas sp. MV1]MDT4329434.1 hypothetical protein [Methylomonas sp. MV1]